jgi:putative transposase
MQTQYMRLTDPQWQIIKKNLPSQRRRKHCLREIVDGILWFLRVGSQWRNLPQGTFPKWQLVYYYFRRWKSDGTLEWNCYGLLEDFC